MTEEAFVFPTSFAQERLWFLDQLVPDNAFYNLNTSLRLTLAVDHRVLESSLNEIIRRHETLRTTFKSVDGKPMQVVAPTLRLHVPSVDLSELPEVEREQKALQLATEESQKPFNLVTGPLLRAVLLCLDENNHIFLLTVHHIIADGWSMGVLFQELTDIYAAFSTGRPSPLQDLPIQYADFAVWQKNWLRDEILDEQLAYWKQQLQDLPLLRLPTDWPRPAVQSYAGAICSFWLPESLYLGLVEFSRKENVTLFMTMLAAWQTLLYRYSGQDDIALGTPVANRNRAELEGLIGFFANTLVLRANLSGNPGFRELLARVRETALGAYAHQDLPFEKLVHELQPERDMGRNPLFQVNFQLYSDAGSLEEKGPFDGESLELEKGTANFDLALDLWEYPDGVWGTLEYSTDLFREETIGRMVKHFRILLDGIVADPNRRLSELPLLTEHERRRLLVKWNSTKTEYPRDKCLHQLFEAQVERTPDAVAVAFREERLTYRELNERSNQLARYLQSLAVGPEVLVAVCVERSLEMVVGLLGILKAGAAYLPLDPTYPAERLASMLRDSEAPVLVTQQKLLKSIPTGSTRPVCLDAEWEPISRNAKAVSQVRPDNLAYVIYTSGSTGKPKGVLISHQSVCNHLVWMLKAFPLAESDRIPQKYPFTFDASICEIFCPLLAGARLIMTEPAERWDMTQFIQLLLEEQITVIDLVPSMLQALLEDERFRTCHSLRRIICGGEALSAALRDRVLAQMNVELANIYGPTEATIGSASWISRRGENGECVPIGHPIANTQIYLLDSHLNPAPVGMPGEIYIGGDGLARGYLNRPELTAEKFIPDPFSRKMAARLYKTGDLARYLRRGEIEWLGRVDQQVKVRGYRIELGEIESALAGHPSIRGCVVLARKDMPEVTRLVAYIVPQADKPKLWPSLGEHLIHGDLPPDVMARDEGRSRSYVGASNSPAKAKTGLDIDTGSNGNGQRKVSADVSGLAPTLRRFLQEQLPEYMVPSAFVVLDGLPLTPSGKVNRRALPAPGPARPELEEAYMEPRDEAERVLAAIWSDLLGIQRIGIRDNFFDLGGDSILSIQIIARANQAGLRLRPSQLFQHQTIAELAAVADTTAVIQAEQGVVTGAVPLTPIQHWFFEQELADAHHYNQSVLMEVPDSIDAARLGAVLNRLVAHHDALRLRFADTEAGWQQTLGRLDEAVFLSHFDFSLVPVPQRTAALDQAAADLQAGLNLSAGPLVRAALFRFAEMEPSQLLIVIHHLAIDGVSWRILLEDLWTAYEQLDEGGEIQLPPKTTSFQHWAHRLMEYGESPLLREEASYWLGVSRDGLLRLPLDQPGGANTVASQRKVIFSLSTEETESLIHRVPKAYHTQINDVLLTALVQAFARLTGQRALLIDLEGHGRETIFEDVDVSRTVGWFTTIFPVLLDLGQATDTAGALKAIKEQLRRIPNRGIGHGLLRYLSGDADLVEKLRAVPQPELSFNYLGQFSPSQSESSASETPDDPTGSNLSPRSERRHLLEIDGGVYESKLQLEWAYSANIHQRPTIERLVEGFGVALRSIISHCSAPGVGGYTPSDFAAARVSEGDLEKLLARIGSNQPEVDHTDEF